MPHLCIYNEAVICTCGKYVTKYPENSGKLMICCDMSVRRTCRYHGHVASTISSGLTGTTLSSLSRAETGDRRRGPNTNYLYIIDTLESKYM